MTHPLAAVHSHMPAALRDSSPLSTWPDDAEWTSRKHTADDRGPWCETDRHADQRVPAAQSQNVSHDDHDFNFRALYAHWTTCEDCHRDLATAQAVQDQE